MIIRRLADGFRKQDWFTVFVEVAIVVIGVYVGIYIGDAAKERALTIEVNKALVTLQVQLKEDLVNVDRIITSQKNGDEIYQRGIDVLLEDRVDEEAFALANEEMLTLGTTFFPNGSAFQTIRDLGYLTEVKDTKLQLLVANLYERIYERQNVFATNLDRITVEFQSYDRDAYWDRYGRKFITDNPEDIIKLRNGIKRLMGYSSYYEGILRRAVRVELEKTIVALDAYLMKG